MSSILKTMSLISEWRYSFMGDVAEVNSNVPLPDDVVYTQREADTEEDRRVEEEQRVPENHGVNESKGSKSTPDELGRHIDVKA
jgi:hypothetical protein